MTQIDIHAATFVRASCAKVWKALTVPETIAAYHPTGMQVAALPEGGHALKRPDDGSTFIREALIGAQEGRKLELSFEPAWADVPDGGSTVTIEITQEKNACKVTLTHSNCAAMGIGDNWDRFLASMKSYLETGSGLRIPPPSAS